MSRKLPIAETAVQSLHFAMGHVWAAIRLGWLPAIGFAALFAAGIAVTISGMPGLLDGVRAAAEGAPAASGNEFFFGMEATEAEAEALIESYLGEPNVPLVLAGALIMTLASLLFVPLAVLLLRSAAGDVEMPGGLFYWQWGAREWRFVGSYIVYAVIILAAMLLLSAIGALAVMGVEGSGDLTVGWVPKVVPIVLVLILAWVFLRTLLIIPAAAIENRLNPLAAFGATGGNVFRLLGSLVLLVILLVICGIAFGIIMFVGSLLFGTLGLSLGDASGIGYVLSAVGGLLLFGLYIFYAIAGQLVFLGWMGGAWAAVRSDGVRSCGDGGPGEGGVCEI